MFQDQDVSKIPVKSIHFKIELLNSVIFNIKSPDIETNSGDVIFENDYRIETTEDCVTRC